MSQTIKTDARPSAPAEASNRVTLGWSNRLLARPEVGALVAAIVIFIFFLIVAPAFRSPASFFTVLYQSSTIGIVAVAVGMLMIGGEFDLSAGVIVTTAGLVNAMFCYQLGINLMGRRRAVARLLPRHRLPQRLPGDEDRHTELPHHPGHVLRAAGRQPRRHEARHRLGVDAQHQPDGRLRPSTRSSPRASRSAASPSRSPSSGGSSSSPCRPSILQRTRIGNWIYAVGGNADSARAVGVPVKAVKIGLFMTVSFLGWFVGMHTLYKFDTLQAGNGIGNEFLYIIAAVVGGTLLTGGYGNAIGVAIGAFIFGMTSLCIVYAGWDPNWFRAFLGVMLLLAVMVNLYVKKLSTARKVG